MSYTSQPTNAQSLNGIISISDGVCSIENGDITGVNYLQVDNLEIGNMTVDNDCLVDGNFQVLGNSTLNTMSSNTADIITGTISNATISNLAGINGTFENLTVDNLTATQGAITELTVENETVNNSTIETAEITNAHIVNAEIDNIQFNDASLANFSVTNKLYAKSTSGYTQAISNLNVNKSTTRHARIKELKSDNAIIENKLTVDTISNNILNTSQFTSDVVNTIVVYTERTETEELSTLTFNLLPAGMVIAWVGGSLNPPSGWLFCRGNPVNKEQYDRLYNAIGGLYGETATTFNLPNFQGCFLRGHNAFGNSAIAGYTTGVVGQYFADTTRAHTHQFEYNDATDGYASGTRTNVTGIETSTGEHTVTTTGLTDDRGFGGGTETAPYHSVVEYLIKT